jgi:nucleoid-associated protein YgaU
MFATVGRSEPRGATTGSARENRSQRHGPAADTETIMMDPAVKVAMALCVLVAGVFAATLFRRDQPQPATSAPPDAAELLIPSRTAAAAPAECRANAASVTHLPVTVVRPLGVSLSPPPLVPKYPEADRPASSHWGGSIDMMLPAKETARTHKIIDGDTLAALAQRYLGSTARAHELFDANRDVLSDPELLPIGAELKIPSNDARQSRP